jgi:hypothetical protein
MGNATGVDLMRHFPKIVVNLSAAVALLTTAAVGALALALALLTLATVGASAGVAGTRTTSLKGEPHSAKKIHLASNCVATSADRLVGAQRVWTPHGVMSLGGRFEKVQTTECR